jgi:hypothetical protein
MKAAAAALPFEHPKLAVVASMRQEDLAEALGRALERSGRVINSRPVQVIEPKPVEPFPQPLPDHSIHTAPVSRSGFSKRRF